MPVMNCIVEAFSDLAELALGCHSCRSTSGAEAEVDADGSLSGGIVCLSGEGSAIKVGVLAPPEACRALARRLLGTPASGSFPDSIVRGAMCELSYLLAGGVRRRLQHTRAMSVGQPRFLDGAVQPKVGWCLHTAEIELDAIPATLVCLVRDDTLELLC
jgi:hypothetical protein